MPTPVPDQTDPMQGCAIAALLAAPEPGVLAVIAGVEGPSYRPVGALMAVHADGTRAGTLSSGCIEADIALHAAEAMQTGQTRVLRYGRGSPFKDIALPCGGGLDIVLIPAPDRDVLAEIARLKEARSPCSLRIDTKSGALACQHDPAPATGWQDGQLRVHFAPDIRFVIFGKGPEAATFAALVRSAGYPNLLLSPDAETLESASAAGSPVQHLTRPGFPSDLDIDGRTAVVLFFHDHEWEPPILARALETQAFYIGAQGSQRARDARLAALTLMGVSAADQERLHGPVGLIPSARDAGTLAVSVLAEVLAKAMR